MKDKRHITRDLGEAAYLITRGCTLDSVLWKDNFAYFCYADPKASELGKEYFVGTTQAPARLFFENLRLIKRKLYESEGGGDGKRQRK